MTYLMSLTILASFNLIESQGCRLPQACTCWNDIRRIPLTGSRARLVCSYFTKAQLCGPDFTHWNWTQENTHHLLLSSFVRFHVWVQVNSLTFVIGNFHPYSSEFISQMAISLQQKSNTEKKGKQIWRMKKRKETENDKTPGSEQPVAKSVCGSLTMRRRAASATIVCRWMHNLQVGRNQGPRKVHSAWTLH